MKKEVVLVFAIIFSLSFVLAEACDLQVSLLNQDPYPAVPGDYVKLVFQISGVENPECGDVIFKLAEQYPIQFDPAQSNEITIKSGTYTKDHSSVLMAPYKVRIDENALNGDNVIEVSFANSKNSITTSFQSQQFDLNIEDVKADFEVFVKDYDTTTKEITLQILNIGENDIYALTVRIPEQENIVIKGADRNIVGDLDSNDYTTTTFESSPKDGSITIEITYTDAINVRRTLTKTVSYDSGYFKGRVADQKKAPVGAIITWIVVIGLAAWFFIRRYQKKKKRK
ncbi:hypothetical protein H8D91_01140 [archaeon]|nr:hypothetical protein [archaeon]